MKLELTVLRCPDTVAPEARTVTGGEFSVGRGPGVDWILPDTDRTLSKRHFALAFRAGAWQLADTSTNGTFINTDDTPLGTELRVLRDGDRVRLGPYEIEVRMEEDAFQSGGYGSPQSRPRESQESYNDPFADPFGMDPLAPPPPPRQPFDGHVHTRTEVAPILPEDDFLQGEGSYGHQPYDPAIGSHTGQPYDPFRAPTQSDHSSVMQDAFTPPRTTHNMPLHTGGTIPGDDLLPDDWDKDLFEGIGTAPAPAPQPPPLRQPPPPPPPVARAAPPPPPPVAYAPPPPPPPMAYAPPPPPEPPPVAYAPPPPPPAAEPPPLPPAHNNDASPFDEPSDLINGPNRLDLGAAPLAVTRPLDPPPIPDFALDPPARPAQPTPRPAPPRPAPPLAAPPLAAPPLAAPSAAPAVPRDPAADAGLLSAFMAGAGLPDLRPADPEAMMRSLGSAFRAVVAGLRSVLIARASIKSEFRIEQTMIRARGNNPLKFSAGDDDALTAILGTGRRVDMAADAAVTDALSDIRLHELATMAAMQSAVRSLMEGLDPAKLRAAAEQGGGLSVLPAQRKARAWDAFEALHTKMLQALSDDFDSVFGKAFARAYERAMDEVSEKERQ